MEYIYIYTHKKNQNSPTKIKYNILIWQKKEIKTFIYQLKRNLKHKPGKKKKKDNQGAK